MNSVMEFDGQCSTLELLFHLDPETGAYQMPRNALGIGIGGDC